MTTTNTSTPIPVEDESHGDDLDYAIRDYVRTYALWHGRAKAAETFGVSRHTLWRCLERGRLGKITAQGGDQDRWRSPRRDRSGGLGHDRQPPDPAPRHRQSPTPGRDPGGHPAAAVRRSPGNR